MHGGSDNEKELISLHKPYCRCLQGVDRASGFIRAPKMMIYFTARLLYKPIFRRPVINIKYSASAAGGHVKMEWSHWRCARVGN